ncbi:MAG: cobalt transporter [Desulfomonile tiedjei]|uniref:Cobalt transporter n=1 Tax=Desulfomonile tiedjei TaxID=2358 RepID=A0A9D6V2Y5_9BACT|nr:cobalt transporter [Desulfomonile tiedjei]
MKKAIVAGSVILVLAIILGSVILNTKAEWSGVDETVVKKFAEEAGRPPAESLIRGDALLFFFLIAGAIGGFIAGYSFRGLFPPEGRISNPSNV